MASLGGKPTGSIEFISQNCPSRNDIHYSAAYIKEKGQQNVQISPGQWCIEPPMPLVTSSTGKVLPGQASTLRFCLTLQTAIERNSIRFPQNQLLLLQCNTFREEQYETGVRTLLPYQYAKEKAQQKLDEQLNHESGDRRLDGTDLLPLLEGYKDVAGLVWDRDDKYCAFYRTFVISMQSHYWWLVVPNVILHQTPIRLVPATVIIHGNNLNMCI
eukprot:CCRYP_007241-RA/>CCRYP_007241-RA protein AED:0.40 eAED:0.22 QI:0/-1/0/1/-1/1/1/0/214